MSDGSVRIVIEADGKTAIATAQKVKEALFDVDEQAGDADLKKPFDEGAKAAKKSEGIFKKVGKSFGELGGKISSALAKGIKVGAKALLVGGGAIMAGAGATLVKSMNLAGELEQNLGGSEAVFEKYASNIQKIGKDAYKNMGLSQSDFLATANKMGSLFQGAGFSVKDSMSMSSDAMQRAADVASIMGIDMDSAMESVAGMAKGNFSMMDNLGVAMNDTAIANYALSKGIKKSTADMTTQEKVGLATQMFMEKTAKYAGNYAKENDTLSGSLQTAKGALSNFMSGAGDIDAVIDSWSNFASVAGKMAGELAPKLFKGLLQAVKDIIPQIPSIVDDLAKGMADVIGEVFGEEAKAKFESLVDTVSGAIDGLKSAFDFVVQNKDIFTPIAVGIGVVAGALVILNGIMTITKGLQAAISLAGGPIGLVILAISALVAGLVYFFTQTKTGKELWKKFTDWLAKTWQSLVKIAQDVWKAITEFFSSAVDKVKEVWNSIGEFFSGLWSGIKEGASNIWSAITGKVSAGIETIKSVASSIGEFFSNLWNGIKNVALTVWGAISSFFSTLWSGIVGVAQNLWNTFGSSLTSIWTGIVNVAKGVWELLKTVIMAPVLFIIDLVTMDFTQLGADLAMIWESIKSAVSLIWDGIKTYFSGVINFIVTFVQTMFNGMTNILIGIWETIKGVASATWNWIKDTISNLISGTVEGAKNLWNGFLNFISNLWENIKSTASNAWNWIKSTINNLINGTIQGAQNAWNNFKSFVSNFMEGVKTTFSNAWNSIKETAINLVTGLVDKVTGIFDKIKDINLLDAGKAIMDSLFDGLKSAWNKVTDFVGGIGDWIRDHKGPIQYDRKLLIPAGNVIMEGLDEGLRDKFRNVQARVSGMAGKIQMAMSPEAVISGGFRPVGASQIINNVYNNNYDRETSSVSIPQVYVYMDPKQAGKGTAVYVKEENDKMTKIKSKIMGV